MSLSIVSTNKSKNPLEKLIGTVIADSEENGGIGGNICKKPFQFPIVVMEERPKTIDPKTGKMVYVDEIKPKGVIYLLG